MDPFLDPFWPKMAQNSQKSNQAPEKPIFQIPENSLFSGPEPLGSGLTIRPFAHGASLHPRPRVPKTLFRF